MKKTFKKNIIFLIIYTCLSCGNSGNLTNEYMLHANLWNVYDNCLYIDSLNEVNNREDGMASARVLCLSYRIHNPYSIDFYLPLGYNLQSTIKANIMGSSVPSPKVDQCEIIGLDNRNYIVHPNDTICMNFRLLNFVNINDSLHKADTKMLLSRIQIAYDLDSLDLDKGNRIIPFVVFENDTNNVLISYRIQQAKRRK